MKNIRHLDWLYAHRGAKIADRYCATQKLIGSVCMCCKRIYCLVDSRRDGGGLSHGWCSDKCARIEQRRMLLAEPDDRQDTHTRRAAESSESVTTLD